MISMHDQKCKKNSEDAEAMKMTNLKDGVLVWPHRIAERPTYRSRYFKVATGLVIPNKRQDSVDGDDLWKNYTNCSPPPIFIISISIVQICVFIYYSMEIWDSKTVGNVPFQSPLIFDPHRRYEVWRFITYMFIHSSLNHILSNLIVQLVLGVLLELVHKYWRILLIYSAGVLAGSLGSSIVDPTHYLAGASGGVYALIAGHIATIILNFKEIKCAIVQLIVIFGFVAYDIGFAIYIRYNLKSKSSTSYAAHFAGALAGLLVGIVVLRNLEKHRWELLIWWISLLTFTVFILAMIVWNVAIPSYFLPPDY